MKHSRRLLYGVIILILVIIITIIATYFIKPLVVLGDNQILYSMSTMAQVVGGLFGLVLAAYAIIDPKLREIGTKDQQALDYVDLLRKEYFQNIIFLSITCSISILLCISTIYLYVFLSNILFSVLINLATLFGVLSIVTILFFGCSLLNPNALNKYSKEERREIENKYVSSKSEEDFRPFVLYYNKLETLITGYAAELLENDLIVSSNVKNRNERIQLFQSLDILMMNEIINREIYEVIDNLRRYRNALVHSVDNQRVNATLFNELKDLYKYLNEVYTNRSNDEERKAAINRLYNYGHKISTNSVDEKLIGFIRQHAGITTNELAAKLQVSKSYISKHIRKLIENGIIEQDSKGYHVTTDYRGNATD